MPNLQIPELKLPPQLKVPEDQAPAPRRARSNVGSALLWSTLGFVAGAAFWHAVGFWGFMSDIVLTGPREPQAQLALAEAPDNLLNDRAKPRVPTIYLVDPTHCTALELDRTAKRTAVRPCPSNGLALRLEPESDREDLAILATSPTLQTAGYARD